jgi:hypothetical protein
VSNEGNRPWLTMHRAQALAEEIDGMCCRIADISSCLEDAIREASPSKSSSELAKPSLKIMKAARASSELAYDELVALRNALEACERALDREGKAPVVPTLNLDAMVLDGHIDDMVKRSGG